MEIETEESKWDLQNWFCQIIFFIITSLFFFYALIAEMHGDTAWWYFRGSIAVIILASLGAAISKPLVRNIITMTTIMTNVFLIPMVLFASGFDLGISAGVSVVYVITIGAISPYAVAIGTGMAAIALAGYLHYENNVFKTIPEFKQQPVGAAVTDGDRTFASDEPIFYKVEKKETNLKQLSLLHYQTEDNAHDIYEANKDKLGDTPNDLKILKGTQLIIPNIKKFDYKSPTIISVLYIVAVALGIGWKMYVIKMLQLCTNALNNSSAQAENEILNLKDELEQSENNCRLLKEEMAIQIIEMNQIAGLNKDS